MLSAVSPVTPLIVLRAEREVVARAVATALQGWREDLNPELSARFPFFCKRFFRSGKSRFADERRVLDALQAPFGYSRLVEFSRRQADFKDF